MNIRNLAFLLITFHFSRFLSIWGNMFWPHVTLLRTSHFVKVESDFGQTCGYMANTHVGHNRYWYGGFDMWPYGQHVDPYSCDLRAYYRSHNAQTYIKLKLLTRSLRKVSNILKKMESYFFMGHNVLKWRYRQSDHSNFPRLN